MKSYGANEEEPCERRGSTRNAARGRTRASQREASQREPLLPPRRRWRLCPRRETLRLRCSRLSDLPLFLAFRLPTGLPLAGRFLSLPFSLSFFLAPFSFSFSLSFSL